MSSSHGSREVTQPNLTLLGEILVKALLDPEGYVNLDTDSRRLTLDLPLYLTGAPTTRDSSGAPVRALCAPPAASGSWHEPRAREGLLEPPRWRAERRLDAGSPRRPDVHLQDAVRCAGASWSPAGLSPLRGHVARLPEQPGRDGSGAVVSALRACPVSHHDYGRKARLKGASRANRQAALRCPCPCRCHGPRERGEVQSHHGEHCLCRATRPLLRRGR